MNGNSFELLKNSWVVLRYTLFEVSGHKISILSLLSAVAIFYTTTLISKMAERGVRRLLAERKDIDSGMKDSILRFTRYTILVVGGFVTLDTVGIKMSSLAAVGAVLMVGIGFGLQNITQNFISGLIILLERPIKVGDLVEVKGVSGKVMEIGARSTLINTRDDVSIIVPNSQFISEQVINETLSGDKIRYRVEVGVAYGTDPRLVERILDEIAQKHSRVLKSPPPKVFFKGFGGSSLDFSLTVWVSDIWSYESILSDIRFMICDAFKEEKVEIPFMQVDLHMKDKAKIESPVLS
ncbi:MAG: mechanosensitive ion channel [Bacteriovoracaceae bacterium]|nr:mechanosensitive ion channel [Bacteriovoracaceae bacterium]